MSKTFKIVAGAVLLLLIIAGAGYYICVPSFEKKHEQQIAAYIEGLPGDLKADSIKVSFWGKKAVVKGLKGKTLYLGSDMDVAIGTIECSGFNITPDKQAGVIPLVDTLLMSDVHMSLETVVQGLEPLRQTVNLKEMTLTDIKGDFGKLDSLPPPPNLALPTPADQQTLQAYADAIATITVQQAVMKDYKVATLMSQNDGPMQATVERIEYNTFSLFNYGPCKIDKLVMDLGQDAARMTLDSCTIKAMRVPNFIPLSLMGEVNPNIEQDILDLFTGQPMVIEGLRLDNLLLKMGSADIRLAASSTDMEIGTQKLAWKQDLQGLIISPEVCAMMGEEWALLAQEYQKPLTLSGKADIEISQKDGSGDIMLREAAVAEQNLGSASLNADLLYEGRGQGFNGLLEHGADTFLRKAQVELEDKGLVELMLTIQHKSMAEAGMLPPDSSPATLRQSMIQSLQPLAQFSAAPDLQKIISGLLQIAAGPGKLSISVNPPEPLNIDVLVQTGGMAPLNATVDFVPAR